MPTRMTTGRQRDIVDAWEQMRMNAAKAKRSFVDFAIKARKYYDGPHDFVFQGRKIKPPSFEVTVNKVYEMLRLFGPMAYAQNPSRNVEPSRMGHPQVAEILKAYLKYTPSEFGLKASSKKSIDEGLLHGRGAAITGLDTRTGLVKTTSMNTRDLMIDPDADTWYAGKYIMRLRRNVPVWIAARIFGEATAKEMAKKANAANMLNYSFDECGGMDPDAVDETDDSQQSLDAYMKKQMSYEAPRVSWIEVYSKMGVGLREKKSEQDYYLTGRDSEDHLLISYEPVSKMVLSVDGWPIPFYADHEKSSWPVSFFDPAENFDSIWPISLIKPAMGEQEFLDWGWAYAMGHIQASARSIIATPKPMDDQLEITLKGSEAITVVPIDVPAGYTIDQILTALKMPQLSPALLAMLQEVELLFEKRTGMNEILYGTSQRSMRSATEAEMKAQFSRMRIDDIIDKVEDWQTEISRKEAVGAFWALGAEEMTPIVGQEAAMMWEQARQQLDVRQLMGEYGYSVISGSTRKRTPEAAAESALMMLERLGPIRLQVGDLPGYNLLEQEFIESLGVPNPQRFLLGTAPMSEEEQMAQQGAQGAEQAAAGAPVPVAPEVMQIVDGQPVMGTPPPEG